MSATEVASLFATLRLDDQLSGGLETARRNLSGFGDGISRAGQRVQDFGGQMTVATLPIAGALGAGIAAASSFENVMAEVGARAGLTASELESVSNFALKMGADTSFSAQQAGEAFLQLLTSGQSVEEAMMTLPAVLDGAAASGEDLGQVADDITNIMASMGVDTEYAADVVDSLARAAGASSADMGSLATGFADVGGQARQFGLSVNRTAAILAIFAENGIGGARAGTQLSSMLRMMSRDLPQTQAAWDELGTSLYDSDGAMRDLPTVIEEINAALATMSDQDANRVINDLVGQEGALGLLALMGEITIPEMEASMRDAAGAAEVADARMSTFSGTVDSLKGSVETLMIEALTPFMEDVLTPLAEDLTGVVNEVTAWVKENPELTGQILAIAAGAVILGPALAAVGFAMKGVGIAVGVLTSPLVLVAGAFAGIMAAGGTLDDFLADVGIHFGNIAGGVKDVTAGLDMLNSGDREGGLALIGDGLRDIGEGVIGIPRDLIVQTADALTQLLGGHDVREGIAAWGPAFEAIGDTVAIVADRVKRGVEDFAWGVEERVLSMVAGLRDAIFDASGGSLDIAPEVNARLQFVTDRRYDREQANWFEEQFRTYLSGDGTLEMQIPMIDFLWDEQMLAENLSYTGRQALEDALVTALATGDEEAVQLMMPLAVQLGFDEADLRQQAIDAMTAATSAPVDVDMMANVDVNAGSININGLLLSLQTTLTGAGAAAVAGAFAAGLIPGRASGGPVAGGSPYIVGEEGPELFVPGRSGMIVPNGAMGGNVTVHLSAYGQSPYDLAMLVQQALRDASR